MGHHDLFDVDGVHVSRLEDMRLITGAGTFASDPLGIHHLDMPLTSAKLWGAISAAKR